MLSIGAIPVPPAMSSSGLTACADGNLPFPKRRPEHHIARFWLKTALATWPLKTPDALRIGAAPETATEVDRMHKVIPSSVGDMDTTLNFLGRNGAVTSRSLARDGTASGKASRTSPREGNPHSTAFGFANRSLRMAFSPSFRLYFRSIEKRGGFRYDEDVMST
jgi:hypothetical protein